jgi:hypothetical protein
VSQVQAELQRAVLDIVGADERLDGRYHVGIVCPDRIVVSPLFLLKSNPQSQNRSSYRLLFDSGGGLTLVSIRRQQSHVIVIAMHRYI